MTRRTWFSKATVRHPVKPIARDRLLKIFRIGLRAPFSPHFTSNEYWQGSQGRRPEAMFRLIARGIKPAWDILANEPQRHPGARVADEIRSGNQLNGSLLFTDAAGRPSE